jgi:hypothetical protein
MTVKLWRKSWVCFLLLSFSTVTSFSQTTSKAGEISCFDIDPSGVIYYFNSKNLIAEKDGKEIARFHTQGKIITSIDVGSGFEILVFYQQQQAIQLFDNRLSELTPFTQLQLPFWINDIKQGVNNEFWVISNAQQKLVKLKRNLSVSMQQNNALFANLTLISEKQGRLYAYSTQDLYLFSNTGALEHEFKQKGVMTAATSLQGFVIAVDTEVFAVDIKTKSLQSLMVLPVIPEKLALFQQEVYYLFEGRILKKSL